MYISTTKSYNNISLSEVKQALRIASTDSTYDQEILSLIQAAVQFSESYIGQNIVYTISNPVDYCINGCYYCLKEPNVTLSAITSTNEAGTVTNIPLSGVTVYQNFNTTFLKFKTSLNAHILNVAYTSGYAQEIPAGLKRAIFIKIAELLDHGSQYELNTMYNTKAWERSLAPYINLAY